MLSIGVYGNFDCSSHAREITTPFPVFPRQYLVRDGILDSPPPFSGRLRIFRDFSKQFLLRM